MSTVKELPLPGIDDDMFAGDVIADPYRYYGRLRAEDPIHWNAMYDLWVVTRHDDVVWMTRNHDLFSSAFFRNDTRRPYPPILDSDEPLYDYARQYMADQFIQFDRPEHYEMRQVLHGYFTPKAIESWRQFIRSSVAELLDSVEGLGEMDVVQDLATPLPVLVIAEMLGVPPDERPRLRALAENLLYMQRGEPERMQPLVDGMQGMIELLEPIVVQRLRRPQDDLLSLLAQGEVSGVFTRHQVLVNASLLFLAGHETTINLICNGTLAFMQHPEQWRTLGTEPEGLAKQATEECLRFDPPVKSIQRLATCDVEMRGKVLRQGDRVRWFISSANRDPEVFREPDVFDILREQKPHVAFGNGIHHCLGATLARLEGQEVFKGLSRRFPRLAMIPTTLEYQPSIAFRSLKALPVSLG